MLGMMVGSSCGCSRIIIIMMLLMMGMCLVMCDRGR